LFPWQFGKRERRRYFNKKMDHDELDEYEEIDNDEFDDIDEEDSDEMMPDFIRKSRRIRERNLETIRSFLSKRRQEQVSVIRPRYYSDLLVWAVKNYVKDEKWKIVKVMGRDAEVPDYCTINTDYDKLDNAMCAGYMLLEKEDSKLVISLKIDYHYAASAVIIGNRKKVVRDFARGIRELAQGKNLYRGKKIEYGGFIQFLKLPVKAWDDLALDESLKEEIRTNSVDFLNRKAELVKYGINPRRGIILAGEPGTGKTLIGKIIMNQSPGITCISAVSGNLASVKYIHELYSLARDLKPSIVFLEDIDLIGEDRRRIKGAALPALLAELDGVEECADVVTIASTNFLDSIDDALRKRPSRFDRIIRLPLPSLEQRRGFIRYLSRKIPMSEEVQEYMACRTENLTPAQIQEVAHSLVIERKINLRSGEQDSCKFKKGDVDRVLALVKADKRDRELGFARAGNNGRNGSGLEHTRVLNSNK
jgi:cell division protease FtsH